VGSPSSCRRALLPCKAAVRALDRLTCSLVRGRVEGRVDGAVKGASAMVVSARAAASAGVGLAAGLELVLRMGRLQGPSGRWSMALGSA
jgi:hypothetical protein